jgi:23S rRNA pseudouridine1911/1915/1917 synthase
VTAWVADPADEGTRLDHFVAARAGCSHARARRVVDAGEVRVNGRRAKKGERVRAGDRVTLAGPIPDPASLAPAPEPDLPLDILHVDGALVALAKPPGLPTHPLQPGERGTLAGALVARYPECLAAGDDPREAGFVHRLDTDTSGAILAARTRDAWRALRRTFTEGGVEKEYLALVAGGIAEPGEISVPLAHDPRDRRRTIAVPAPADQVRLAARAAHTRYEPIAQTPDLTLIRAIAHTGRMHQIRAHLASIGQPLVGDALYGGPPALAGTIGHFLHAARLSLDHPSGGRLEVAAPLPRDRSQALRALGLRW